MVCYKYTPLKNNQLPLKLRITYKRKRRYVNLGVFTKPEDWDFQKNRPKPNAPDREYIEQIIDSKLLEVRSKILELKALGKDYTLSSLIDALEGRKSNLTVKDLFLSHLSSLRAANRCRYADSIELTYKSLIQFNGLLDIYFPEIDITWLKRFELWLRNRGLSENTIGIRFRNLRVLYNLAIERGYAKPEQYPFRK